MAEFRIWHASRDPYHCVYRMLRLLAANSEAMPVEKLRILDMFLMYPVLLHKLSLPMEIKEQFRELNIEPIAKSFVRLPGIPSIWQDLQLYQSVALKQLAGRGLLKRDALRERYASLEQGQVPSALWQKALDDNEAQMPLVSFLIDGVASLPVNGVNGLVKRAGLPARGPVL